MQYIKQLLISSKLNDYQTNVVGVFEDVVNKSKLLHMLSEEVVNSLCPFDYESMNFFL
jgi:hypothetical protein